MHESLAGEKLDSLVKALQEAGGCPWAWCSWHCVQQAGRHGSWQLPARFASAACTPHAPGTRAPFAGVTLHGGERAAAALSLPAAPSARHEYSSLDCTLELVSGLDQAIDHIHAHGSGHTESIITGALEAAGHLRLFSHLLHAPGHAAWLQSFWTSCSTSFLAAWLVYNCPHT